MAYRTMISGYCANSSLPNRFAILDHYCPVVEQSVIGWSIRDLVIHSDVSL